MKVEPVTFSISLCTTGRYNTTYSLLEILESEKKSDEANTSVP
jgi:hypothetical protein